MPSPIAHSIAGYAVFQLTQRIFPELERENLIPPALLTTIGFSLLPDIDSGIGLLTGQFSRYHNNLTHSLLVGSGFALLFALILHRRGHPFRSWFTIALLAYSLHILMDGLSISRGVMALWPITPARFVSPIPLFYGLHWSDGWVSIRHLWTLLSELGFAAFILILLHAPRAAEFPIRRRKKAE